MNSAIALPKYAIMYYLRTPYENLHTERVQFLKLDSSVKAAVSSFSGGS